MLIQINHEDEDSKLKTMSKLKSIDPSNKSLSAPETSIY